MRKNAPECANMRPLCALLFPPLEPYFAKTTQKSNYCSRSSGPCCTEASSRRSCSEPQALDSGWGIVWGFQNQAKGKGRGTNSSYLSVEATSTVLEVYQAIHATHIEIKCIKALSPTIRIAPKAAFLPKTYRFQEHAI